MAGHTHTHTGPNVRFGMDSQGLLSVHWGGLRSCTTAPSLRAQPGIWASTRCCWGSPHCGTEALGQVIFACCLWEMPWGNEAFWLQSRVLISVSWGHTQHEEWGRRMAVNEHRAARALGACTGRSAWRGKDKKDQDHSAPEFITFQSQKRWATVLQDVLNFWHFLSFKCLTWQLLQGLVSFWGWEFMHIPTHKPGVCTIVTYHTH